MDQRGISGSIQISRKADRKKQQSSDDKITEWGWADDKITDRLAQKAKKRLEKLEKSTGERLVDESANSNSTFFGASTDDKITVGSNKTIVSQASAGADDKITACPKFTDDKITANFCSSLGRDDKITRLSDNKNDLSKIKSYSNQTRKSWMLKWNQIP